MEMATSDCVHAGDSNPQGMVWCKKKNIYVSALEKDTCPDYVKK
jgi:hypothetical protein